MSNNQIIKAIKYYRISLAPIDKDGFKWVARARDVEVHAVTPESAVQILVDIISLKIRPL